MNLENKILYITIITLLCALILALVVNTKKVELKAYNRGIDKGKLVMLESFKFIYMPAGPSIPATEEFDNAAIQEN